MVSFLDCEAPEQRENFVSSMHHPFPVKFEWGISSNLERKYKMQVQLEQWVTYYLP